MTAAQALVEFGFTALESEIYAFLAGESPATGYRVAQAISKPAANTYKAIQTLERKGAIVVEEGETRLCSAVAPEELLDRLAREFNHRREQAKLALTNLGAPAPDDKLYSINSTPQLLARAEQAISESENVILILGTVNLVRRLEPALRDALSRGIDVVIKASGDVAIPGADVVWPDESTETVPGERIQMAVDARQFLTGIVNPATDEVIQAVWSRSVVLAVLQHKSLAAEIVVTQIGQKVAEDAGRKQLARTLSMARHTAGTLGYEELRQLLPGSGS